MTLSLFDLRPVALAQAPEPKAGPKGEVCEESHARTLKHPALLPDVLRVLVHKTNRANPELGGQNGAPTGREFWLVQLRDGSYAWHYTDNGQRGPATVATSDWLVEQMLATNDWYEVRV